jgi:hypothetical protein
MAHIHPTASGAIMSKSLKIQPKQSSHTATRAALSRALASCILTPVALAVATSALAADVPSDSAIVSYAGDVAYGASDVMNATGLVLQAVQLVTPSATTSNGSVNVPCPVSGSITASWVKDATTKLPTYTMLFNACAVTQGSNISGSYSQAIVGSDTTRSCTTKDKASCTMTTTQQSTAQFNNVSVNLSYGAVTLSGSTAFNTKDVTLGNSTTSVNELNITGGNVLTLSTSHTFSARASSFSLSQADITRTTTATSGVKTGSAITGMATFTVNPYASNPLSFSGSFNGAVAYDTSGVANSGGLTVVLPPNTFKLTVVPGSATICVDLGSNGSCDKTIPITWADWQGMTL